ncbi:MAG: hypothetical protein JRH01_19995 [Deltaproteobacteria bacterium]|nr:hypothetical protein [Deltaproteobacteria bacterium]MBW2395488.1 hypothetical protein [Deltaproteobacteria bacterium]
MATPRTASCPAEVLDWIAWYAEPELPNHVRGAIDRHAAECLACREELSWIQDETDLAGGDAPDAERVFSQVLERVREEVDVSLPAPRRPRSQQSNLLAAAAAVLILVGGAWLGLSGTAPEPLFTASAPSLDTAMQPAVEVIFRDDASWAEIRETLARLDLLVVAAPANTSGRLRLAIVAESGLAEAELTDALAGLRASGLTLFAERAQR